MTISRSLRGKENAVMSSSKAKTSTTIRKMFQEGAALISSKRSDNLFQELEKRELTSDEQAIIEQRVKLQRQMLAAYERQETLRKVQQLREVHPNLTDKEAERALSLCFEREDEAAAKLATDRVFLALVRAMDRPRECLQESQVNNIMPIQPKKKKVNKAAAVHDDEQVFVGVFRARGFPPSNNKDAEPSSGTGDPVGTVTRTSGLQQKQEAEPESSDMSSTNTSATAETVSDLRPGSSRGLTDDASSDNKSHQDSPAQPQRQLYALAKQTESGKIVMATSSDVRGLDEAVDAKSKKTLTPPSIKPEKAQAQNPARMRCMEELTAARAQSDEDHRCTARCVQKMEGKRRTRGAAKCYKEDSDGEWEDEIMVIENARPCQQTDKAQLPGELLLDSTKADSQLRMEETQFLQKDRNDTTVTASEACGKDDALQCKAGQGSDRAANCEAAYPQEKGKPKGYTSAISARGYTMRGRVRQKSHKSAQLVAVGSLRAEEGWFNHGYIFPDGFHSKVNFRSSLVLDQLCIHECSVIGQGGEFWPQPTFRVAAMDRPQEPLVAKSCTGCWSGILKRINTEINRRRAAGEDLPPPPKTAIAGPEYFGLNQPEIQDAIETLDPQHLCAQYWQGKADRLSHAGRLPAGSKANKSRPPAAGSRSRRKRTRVYSAPRGARGMIAARESVILDRDDSSGDEDEDAGGGNAGSQIGTKWSAVNRQERYKNRCGGVYVDEDNPLPGWMDPVTLEPAVSPAISPWGHVMGMATWKAVLSGSGKCPFTQRALAWEQCQVLTKGNIERFKGRVIADEATLKQFDLL